MSQATKAQRRVKRLKKEARRQVERSQRERKLSPWEAPKMKFFKMPQLLKDGIPWEQRLRILRTIGEKSKTEFNERFPNIQRWLTNYDPVYVLSMCAFYFIASEEGIDRETTGDLDFPHHYLEIMQAFALYQERSHVLEPLRSEMDKLKQEMIEVGQSMSLRLLAIPATVSTQDEVSAHHLRMQMMSQTTAVRNWAYQHQMRKITLDLAGTIHAEFLARYNVDPVKFFAMIFTLVDERDDLLNVHISKFRSVVKFKKHHEILLAYNAAFPENVPITGEVADELWARAGRKKDNLLSMLMMHSDLKLEELYTFSLDHALEILGDGSNRDAVKALLDRLSHRFGDLAAFNKEHLILSNPVNTRPFIQLDNEKYFTAIWGTLPHFSMDHLEELLWDDNAIRNKYTRLKADYLEDELERMVRNGFPNATVHRGSRWRDPVSGVEYENDLLVIVDGFALILEAKSASITDPARRGAPDRLTATLKELVEEPSEQAHRFIERLQGEQRIHTFKTRKGPDNIVDSSRIKYYIPVGVTLSHLGSIGSNLKKLIKAGITPKALEHLAPSISLSDLESVFELLPLEIEKIHYLARRREFEAHMEYEGDELDLLGFYLDTGFNIGQIEYDNSTAINMLLKSKELDPYFMGSREGKQVVKPALLMTAWWRDMLARISEVRKDGWIETGFILLNTSKEDQVKFERDFKKLSKRIQANQVKMPHNFVIWRSGPDRRRYVIAGYPYTTLDKDLRNSVIDELLHSEHSNGARGVLVLGIDLLHSIYPYNILARKTATNLFDTLTL